jgi:hypothetical protein
MILDYDLVKWVLNNYYELSHGIWPDPEIDENVSKRTQVSAHANYESPSGLAGDVSARVLYCGKDGLLAVMCYGLHGGFRHRPSELARKYHIEFDEVVAALRRVTWWCTDEEYGRGLKYGVWKKTRRSSRKIRVPATSGGVNP